MSEQRNHPTEIAPTDLTLDAPPSLVDASSSGGSSGPRVHIVEGSGPALSGETNSVLQARLKTSALTLFGGFMAFGLWQQTETLLGTSGYNATPSVWLFAAHAAVTIALGALGMNMCRKCAMSPTALHVKEALIFGLPALFFVLMQTVTMAHCATQHGYVPMPGTPWVILIFTYAMFILNGWRRAALVIGAMAATPLITSAAIWMTMRECDHAFAAQDRFFHQLTLVMGVSAVSAVVGVRTIGALRKEAFQARQLGQYNLRHLIGAGGMGEVYLAEHRLLKRPCAIKLIRPDKAGDPQVLARFEREVKSSAKLSHWNNIDIYDYGHADDGTFYYVMEFLPGLNLQELVQRYGPLPPERVIHLLGQVCDALGEAHGANMVHRDIKPANIFAAQRGGLYDVAKLLDFGLVKPIASLDSANLTQDGSITGSPLYMSPEQSTGDDAPDRRSDIY
ncbi:MAG: protein kinase, partial [Planctomycetales bacterium]|nr:protein kinase [Planctomycetales bacterium]